MKQQQQQQQKIKKEKKKEGQGNLSPSGLKMPNTELGMGRIIFIKLALKILKLDVRILKAVTFTYIISTVILYLHYTT